NVPADRYEAFAFAIKARSDPLGAVTDAKGPFADGGGDARQVNLTQLHPGDSATGQAFNFTEHRYDHSAQFMSDNMTRKYYWNQLLQAFSFKPAQANLWSNSIIQL